MRAMCRMGFFPSAQRRFLSHGTGCAGPRRSSLLHSRTMDFNLAPPIASLLHAQRLDCRAGSASLPVHLLRFDVRQFHMDAFAQAGVARPAVMDRCVPKRQAEYLFGRLAARRALADLGWPDGQVGTGPQREPLWPDGVLGAISHTDTLAAATAVPAGRFRGVGIDIEAALHPDAIASTEQYAMNPQELHVLRRQTALPYALALAAAFSAKETIYKALFPTVGRYFGFEAVRIDALEAQQLHFTAMETLCPDWRAGSQGRVDAMLLDPQTILTSYGW